MEKFEYDKNIFYIEIIKSNGLQRNFLLVLESANLHCENGVYTVIFPDCSINLLLIRKYA
jgi:hypothetical protein